MGPKVQQQEPHSWWWWWWELGAALISIVSMGLVVALLAKFNNTALSTWSTMTGIQPNSLIAIFTTIAKSAMMVSVTSCLSQQKWRHFTRQPQPLDHLQTIDDASRGPWGSLMLLCNIKMWRGPLIVWSFAIITIASLGREASTQQTLEFPTRTTEIASGLGIASPGIAIATSYEDSNPITSRMLASQAIVNSALGIETRPYYTCPALAVNNCTFPPYTTLAVCGKYRNHTDKLTRTCAFDRDIQGTYCNYTWPEADGYNWPVTRLAKTPARLNFHYMTAGPTDVIWESDVLAWFNVPADPDDHGPLLFNNIILHLPPNQQNLTNGSYPNVDLWTSNFHFCAQTFTSTTVTPDGTIDLGPSNNEVLTGPDLFSPKTIQAGADKIHEFTANSTNQTFHIKFSSVKNMYSSLVSALTVHLTGSGAQPWNSINELSDKEKESGQIGRFLYDAYIPDFTAAIASTFLNLIRDHPQTSHPELVRDNTNSTILKGKAFSQKTYIRVRWQWLILPLLAPVLTTVLLVVTIVLASSKQPLFKSSILALMFHGLDNWEAGNVDGLLDGVEMEEKLQGAAGGLMVKFSDEGGDGRFGFVRGV